jgi:hypothetical protein
MQATKTTAGTHEMTAAEATDEAVLRLIRKLGRLHPAAYADVIRQLPEGAREQLEAAERRADVLRDQHGISSLTYPAVYPSDCDFDEN